MGSVTDDDHEGQTDELQVARLDAVNSISSHDSRLSPSMRIVAAVAEATGDDPATMAPLYETIDTDALDDLLGTGTSLEVVFEYDDHAVEVDSDGHVSVDGAGPTRG